MRQLGWCGPLRIIGEMLDSADDEAVLTSFETEGEEKEWTYDFSAPEPVDDVIESFRSHFSYLKSVGLTCGEWHLRECYLTFYGSDGMRAGRLHVLFPEFFAG